VLLLAATQPSAVYIFRFTAGRKSCTAASTGSYPSYCSYPPLSCILNNELHTHIALNNELHTHIE
jgi:hypothetical protein